MKLTAYDIAFKNALVKEHRKIFKDDGVNIRDEYAEVLNSCPVCNNKDYTVYCVKDSFVHKKCTDCGLVYVDPRLNAQATISFYNSEVNEVYNEEKFHNIDKTGPDDYENLKNFELLSERLNGEIKGKKLLEVGCGKGTFLAKAAAEGFDVHGIEVNDLLVEKLKKITPNIYQKDLLDLDLPADSFDVIYFRDYAEHIPNINAFLAKISKLLKPGGTVLIDTHNINSVVNNATKEYHTVIFAFEHPVHWSPDSLTFAARKAGLEFQHLHMDHSFQRLGMIINYRLYPSFTYIFPPKSSKFRFFILKAISLVLNRPGIRHLDDLIVKTISRSTRGGAKMQIFFTKNIQS